MYKHILIPTDGSAHSEEAARQGIAFAKSINARVTAVIATPTFHTFSVSPLMVTDTSQQFQKDCEMFATKALGVAKGAAAAAGVPFEAVHAVKDHPWEAIIETAKRCGCDLIFMASHGHRGITGLVLGSETTKVLTHCKIPVLVNR